MKRRNDEIEDVEYRERKERGGKVKLSILLCLTTLMAFTIYLIAISPVPILPSNEQKTVIDEFLEENGEIIQPTEENASTGQDLRNFVIDDDGGYWVIEALLVPEEWKE